jgi:PadR family transcriptional regulator, regulatory protein AphA
MERPLTATNYFLLGLLALRPQWSAYDLVQQSQRNLRFLWPRAESKVYEAAKRLNALGLATTTQQPTGRRRRTMYSITPQGRRALRAWLRQPGAGPALEFEGALKLFFADQGTKHDALATVHAIEQWATDMRATGAAIARETHNSDGGPFPERLHVNALITELIWNHVEMIEQWVGWAGAQIEDWDGTSAQPQRHDQDMTPYRRRLK